MKKVIHPEHGKKDNAGKGKSVEQRDDQTRDGQIVKKQSPKTNEKIKCPRLSDVKVVESSTKQNKQTDAKKSTEKLSLQNKWSSTPLSEYVIEQPIPNLDEIRFDKGLTGNYFKDVPDIGNFD